MSQSLSARGYGARLVVVALLALLLPGPPAGAGQAGLDLGTVTIIKEDETLSAAEVSVRLSEATPFGHVDRVLIARDDAFADALSSGLLQRESPLLLVPGEGPVPSRVTAEIARLEATEALVLGGPQAVSDAVVGQLATSGLAVRRTFGPDRISTAVAVAETGGAEAETAILARAFGLAGAPESQAFADALSAGGLSAENGWPVLLTGTDVLADATRDYLQRGQISRVLIVGGTAAISSGVAFELMNLGLDVERIAGDSRAGTATAVAARRGADSAADVARVVLVDGDSPSGWQGGFAAAAHSAALDAPIVLTGAVRLPPESEAFLGEAEDQTALTCVAHPLACAEGRRALGIRDQPILAFDPPTRTLIEPGQELRVQFLDFDGIQEIPVTIDGTCLETSVSGTPDDDGLVTVSAAEELDGLECTIQVLYELAASDQERTTTTVYRVDGDPLRLEGDVSVFSSVVSVGAAVPDSPVVIREQRRCVADGNQLEQDLVALQARYLPPGETTETTFRILSRPAFVPDGTVCNFEIDPPAEADQVFWGIYTRGDASLRRPLGLGTGTTAGIELSGLGADAADLVLQWVVGLESESPTLPAGLPESSGRLDLEEGADVTCGGFRFLPGVSLFSPEEFCEARSIDQDELVWVIRPGARHIVARHATFTLPSELPGAFVQVISRGAESDPPAGTCQDPRPLPLGQLSAGQHVAGLFDAWEVTVPADAAVRIRANSAEFTGQLLPIGLRARTPDGQTIADVEPTDSRDGTLMVLPPGSGTVCLDVRTPQLNAGSYWISADRAPVLVESGEVVERFEPVTYDVDVPADRRLVIEVLATDEMLDPFVEVFDEDGDLLSMNFLGRVGRDARIELDVDEAMTLTVAVEGETTIGAEEHGGTFVLSGSIIPIPSSEE